MALSITEQRLELPSDPRIGGLLSLLSYTECREGESPVITLMANGDLYVQVEAKRLPAMVAASSYFTGRMVRYSNEHLKSLNMTPALIYCTRFPDGILQLAIIGREFETALGIANIVYAHMTKPLTTD